MSTLAVATANAILAELQPMRGAGIVSLADVLATLEPELSSRRDEEKTSRYGAVFIASLAESSGMRFPAVFVPGLNEGVLPKPVREDPLLLDSQRLPLGMATSEDDALLLRSAIAAATQQITCS